MTAPLPPTLDYAAPSQRRHSPPFPLVIAAIGIALPYLARLPGVAWYGPQWLAQYVPRSIGAFVFLTMLNSINWVAVMGVTCVMRTRRAAIATAAIGFALPAYAHATLDLRADAQAAIALIFIPIGSIGCVAFGALVGKAIDRWGEPRRR